MDNIKDGNQTIGAALEKVEKNFEWIEKNFERVEKNFEKIEKNFDRINEKIENLRGSANIGFENVDMQFRDLKEEIKK